MWPPSPIVEDEGISLAKEFGADSTDSDSSHGIPPADSRGLVDQYPLIIDVNEKSQTETKPATPTVSGSKNASQKPTRLTTRPQDLPQPTNVHPETRQPETRFVHIPACSDTERHIPPAPRRPRSKSTIGIAADEEGRGRPHVHRIKTDLGTETHQKSAGRLRPPSPYAYRASTSDLASVLDDKSKVSLLSPDSAALPPRPSEAGRRARSQRPNRSERQVNSSDDDRDRRESYRRHRSKSRVDRGGFSRQHTSSGDEPHTPSRSKMPADAPRRSEGMRPIVTHRSAHGNITPPQTPGHTRESPYASAAEESDRRRRMERRHSKESPYTSATEGRSSRREEDRHRARPRRRSVHRSEKPRIDLADQKPSGALQLPTPQSARTPRSLEADLEQAFKENQQKTSRKQEHDDAGPSPLASPPTSPPRTPRGERKGGDYFAMTAPTSAPTQQRSRPPSLSENPLKSMGMTSTLLGAATYGAATLAAKSIPNLSRTSTTSGETLLSSGSQGSVASGQRSRKPSPVYEDPRPISRAGSTASNDENISLRSHTLPSSERPVSRAGSTASQDAAPSRASTYPGRDERPSSRSGPTNLTPPHLAQAARASSYSSIPEQAHLRPSARRSYSTANGATVSVASSGGHARHTSSNLAQAAYTPASYAASPTSSEKPIVVSNNTEQKKPISFPMCPLPFGTAGVQGWHTLTGFQNFDICPSCTRVLGESPLRDVLVPNQWKPVNEEVKCAVSRPWIRIVIARSFKDGVPNLGLLQSLTTLPPEIYPCPARQPVIRRWYHVKDPNTKAPVQNFNVCTACVRSAELVFPELWKEKIFERPDGTLAQERHCNMFTGSKHFYSIVNELDLLARYSKKRDLRNKDIVAFGEFVRQKARSRECGRDTMLATPLWHFIEGLPELTICEECYEEVVWPLRDKPIARDVGTSLQKVPIQRPAHYVAGISCQLYSDRMRRMFKEAVARNDFELLRSVAQQRYNMEHQLQDWHKRFEMDVKMGYNRQKEIQQNLDRWRQYE